MIVNMHSQNYCVVKLYTWHFIKMFDVINLENPSLLKMYIKTKLFLFFNTEHDDIFVLL